MARRTSVVVFDDLDGTPGARPVKIGLDGKWYSIDLNADHEQELRLSLRPYLDAAVTGLQDPKKTPAARSTYNALEVRKWLWDKNISVSARGRIPRIYLDMYDQRHANPDPVDVS